MVRPWMVALLQVLLLLLPLTDRSFGISRPAGVTAAAAVVAVAHEEAAPATTGDEADATAVDANTTGNYCDIVLIRLLLLTIVHVARPSAAEHIIIGRWLFFFRFLIAPMSMSHARVVLWA